MDFFLGGEQFSSGGRRLRYYAYGKIVIAVKMVFVRFWGKEQNWRQLLQAHMATCLLGTTFPSRANTNFLGSGEKGLDVLLRIIFRQKCFPKRLAEQLSEHHIFTRIVFICDSAGSAIEAHVLCRLVSMAIASIRLPGIFGPGTDLFVLLLRRLTGETLFKKAYALQICSR